MDEAFEKLLELAGGYGALARTLSTKDAKLTRQAVHQWKGKVPDTWLDAIDRLYGIAPWTLRPDLYRPRKRAKKK